MCIMLSEYQHPQKKTFEVLCMARASCHVIRCSSWLCYVFGCCCMYVMFAKFWNAVMLRCSVCLWMMSHAFGCCWVHIRLMAHQRFMYHAGSYCDFWDHWLHVYDFTQISFLHFPLPKKNGLERVHNNSGLPSMDHGHKGSALGHTWTGHKQ